MVSMHAMMILLTFVSLYMLQMMKDFLAAHNTQDVGIVPKEGTTAASDGSDVEEDGDEAKKKVLLDAGKEGRKATKDADGDVVMPDAGGFSAGSAAGGLADAQPKYLTPTEAREMMKRIWKENSGVLKYIFPGSSASDDGLASTSGIEDGDRGKQVSSWQDFFLQTIPVAPNRYVMLSNVCICRLCVWHKARRGCRGSDEGLLTHAVPPDRFRPANNVGDMVYEHPQNTILVKILNGNLDLVALSKEENSSMASMTQTLRLWLQLQNALNALLDSSTADDTFGITGIRQQLEKKEGLFRYGFGWRSSVAHPLRAHWWSSRGSFAHQSQKKYDGKACQLCGPFGHFSRRVPQRRRDRRAPVLCISALVPRARHALERREAA